MVTSRRRGYTLVHGRCVLTLFLIFLVLLFGAVTAGTVAVILGIRRKTKWGINVAAQTCCRCGKPAPGLRRPANYKQAMWGGWTCPACGMEMDKWGRAAAAVVLVCLLGCAGAQEGVDPTTTITARSTLVLVPTTVRTKAGAPVFTLEAKDFLVTDDGVPQKVRLEEDSGSLPLALAVVVEAGGDGRGKLDEYGGLGTMVEAIAGAVPHRLALIGFDSEPALVQPWTESFTGMDKALADLGPGDGKDAVLDALAFAVAELKKQPAGYRRAILLVSETVDHGSRTKMYDALRAVSETNTAVYALGFSSTRAKVRDEGGGLNQSAPGPPHGCMGFDPNLDVQPGKVAQAYDCLAQLAPPLRLVRMALIAALGGLRTNVPETVARITGGEYFKFENAKGLEKGLQAISNRMPNRYFLSFQPVQPVAGLHAVGVELVEPRVGVMVEARKSYWAE